MAATDAIAAAAAGKDTQSSASSSRNKLANDMNTFLTLLTTQLKHQDPLSPMDSSEFTNQLVQFASVEQQINANENLESLIGMQQQTQAATAVSYIGKSIEADADKLPLQNGEGRFRYKLDEASASTSMVIRDDAGRVVFNTEGDTDAGWHDFTWNGQDNFGFPLEDGVYELSVTAATGEGENVSTKTTVIGDVTSVSSEDGKISLSMTGLDVSLADVLAVHERTTTSDQTN